MSVSEALIALGALRVGVAWLFPAPAGPVYTVVDVLDNLDGRLSLDGYLRDNLRW